jgi:hypothetical protein
MNEVLEYWKPKSPQQSASVGVSTTKFPLNGAVNRHNVARTTTSHVQLRTRIARYLFFPRYTRGLADLMYTGGLRAVG